jgi:hypothetical protein
VPELPISRHLAPTPPTQAVLDCGLLPVLRGLLDGGNTEIAREAAFTTSNLLAGTAAQLEATLLAGVVPALYARLDPIGYEDEVGRPYWPRTNWAAVALANVLLRGRSWQVTMVVAQGCESRCA